MIVQLDVMALLIARRSAERNAKAMRELVDQITENVA
jgi:hypothetical protein